MKRTTVVCIVLGALLVFSAVASAQPVKLVFWHIFGPGSVQYDLIERAVAEFNQKHQDSIEVVAQVQDFWTFHEQVYLALAGGVPPDIILGDIVTTKRRASDGTAVNLRPFMERDGIDPGEFWPSAIDAAMYQGGIYSLPFDTDTRVFYYNKAHFAESGLDPNSPPQTWSDLERMAPALTRPNADGGYDRVGFHPTWGNAWFMPWAFTNAGQWFDSEGRPTIDHPNNIEALEWVVGWIQRYGKAALDDFAQKFSQGEPFTVELLSTVLETNGYAERIKRNNPDLDFGITYIPVNKTQGSWGAGFDLELVVTPQAAYDQAWEFVKHLLSEEFMVEWVELTRGFGARPQAAVRAVPNDPNFIASVNQMMTTTLTPYSFEVPDWWQLTYPHIDRAIGLQVDPRNALLAAQQEVEGRYRQATGN